MQIKGTGANIYFQNKQIITIIKYAPINGGTPLGIGSIQLSNPKPASRSRL
jgi:hypothetical protein